MAARWYLYLCKAAAAWNAPVGGGLSASQQRCCAYSNRQGPKMNRILMLNLPPQKSGPIIHSQAALLWQYFCDCWATAKLPYFPLNEHKYYEPEMVNRYFPIPKESGVLTYETANALRVSFLRRWNYYIAGKDRINDHRINCGKRPKIVVYTPERNFDVNCTVPFLPKHWYWRKYDDALKLLTREQSCYLVVPLSKQVWKKIRGWGTLRHVSVGSEYAYLHIVREDG